MKLAAAPSTLVVTEEIAGLATMVSRVDPEGARRIMEMLVNLYADRILAIVREYVSNAVDATRAAGSTVPVEVTTPTLLEPNLVVTDRGTGMSVEEVEATFLAFAASTKRDTNEMIGGLGIGAKSAWALAESFLVDTVKDGRRTLVRAARDLSHQVLLAGEPTDLPTGTTISIPVEIGDNSSKWVRTVAEVATAHDPDAVKVDGKLVASIAAGPSRIGPVICKKIRDDFAGKVLIRSGGTLFSSVQEITNRVLAVTKLNNCVVELPIGSFDHTPSRESIVATDRTTAAVTAALAVFTTEFAALEQRIAALASTDVGAAVKLRHSVLGDVAPYTVLPINLSLQVPEDIGAWKIRTRPRERWIRTDSFDHDNFLATHWAEELKNTIVVSGLPKGRTLRSFATYLKSNHSGVRRVIPIAEGQTEIELAVVDPKGHPTGQTVTFDATMVPAENHYTFEKWIQVTKVERAPRGTVAAGYQCVRIAKDGDKPETIELTAAEIASHNLPVFYTEGEPPRHYSSTATKASIGVYLGKRKESPLLAVVPEAMTEAQWQDVRHASRTAGWSEILKLAVTARISNRAVTRRFSIAAEARRNLETQGDEIAGILDRVSAVHAAIEGVTQDQETIWEAGKATDDYRTVRDRMFDLDSDLTAAYPLLATAGEYRDTCASEVYVEYITRVPARSR